MQSPGVLQCEVDQRTRKDTEVGSPLTSRGWHGDPGCLDWEEETQELGEERKRRRGNMARTNLQLQNIVGQVSFHNKSPQVNTIE